MAWARQRSVIDVLDMDCQGCELHMLTTFRDVLQGDVLHKTKVLIIGTHDEDGNEVMRHALQQLGEGWEIVHELPGMFGKSRLHYECRKLFRSPETWAAQAREMLLQQCKDTVFWHARRGPVMDWDGELIAVNRRFRSNEPARDRSYADT